MNNISIHALAAKTDKQTNPRTLAPSRIVMALALCSVITFTALAPNQSQATQAQATQSALCGLNLPGMACTGASASAGDSTGSAPSGIDSNLSLIHI